MIDDWDLAVSPQTLVDQVEEAGADFGLCAVVDEEMGRVFVCELEHAPEVYSGLGDCSRMGVGRRLMSVDDTAPFDAIHENRIRPGETDPAERYRQHDAAIQAAKQRKSDDMLHEFKGVMARRLRGGALFYPGMNDILHVNRAARRARAAERRRGG